MKKWLMIYLVFMICITGCASWVPHTGYKQAGSAVDYLYPNNRSEVKMIPEMTNLKIPVRVGIAFAPTSGQMMIPESEQQRMLQKVKDAFSSQSFISSIEVIPSLYLKPKGGFANLEQAASMFNVDVVALLSYDQIQFNDNNILSVLYWTIVGAYIVHGDQYDIHTMVDVSIFDVKSRKLLFRSPGSSQMKGGASMANFSERSRVSRIEGFNQALDQMIPALKYELDRFKDRLKNDETLKQSVKVEYRPGYGGGSLGILGLLIACLLIGIIRAKHK